MRYFIITLIVLIFTIAYMDGEEREQVKQLEEFYKASCVALPGQVSIMKWLDNKPVCERKEAISANKGNNLLSWRE